MEHTDAVKLQAVEKYILGELPPSLREEFEAHYFDCAECALDVRTGVAFAAGSKQYFKEPTKDKVGSGAPRPDWFLWLKPLVVVPTFAALLFVIGYQNLVSIPHLKQNAASGVGAISPWFSLAASDVRGAAGAKLEVPPNHGFLLFVPITTKPRDPSSRFLMRLEDSSGNMVVRSTVSASDAKKPVPFSVPPLSREGEYKIVILEEAAGSSVQVASLPFAIAFSVQIQQH